MTPARKSRSILLSGLVVLLAGLAPAAAGAAPVATEQYVLTLPGVEQIGVSDPTVDADNEPPATSDGVTGERIPASAPLAALASLLLSPWVLLTLGATAAVAVALIRSTRRPS
jgi:hypothetical protein